jgi:Methyltransferase domain
MPESIQVDMNFLQTLADPNNTRSFSHRFRIKRFRYFLEFVKDLPKPIKILDAGGTQLFWEQMNFTSMDDVNITILNKEPANVTLPNFRFILGDAANMNMFKENEFDVVFSNSVIEHASNFEIQKKMASEISRVGKKYFVQTPNFFFPIEPHFLFPFFQFLPQKLKKLLFRNLDLGWHQKEKNSKRAGEIIDSIHLLKFGQLKTLFPDSQIKREKIFCLTKSFIVIGKFTIK